MGRYTFHGARLVAVEYRPVRIDALRPAPLPGRGRSGGRPGADGGRQPGPAADPLQSALTRPSAHVARATVRERSSARRGRLRPGRGRPPGIPAGRATPASRPGSPGGGRAGPPGCGRPARKTAARNSARKVSIQRATAPSPPSRQARKRGRATPARSGPQGDRLRGIQPAADAPRGDHGQPHRPAGGDQRDRGGDPPLAERLPQARPRRVPLLRRPQPLHRRRSSCPPAPPTSSACTPAPASSRALRRDRPAPVSLAITGTATSPASARGPPASPAPGGRPPAAPSPGGN